MINFKPLKYLVLAAPLLLVSCAEGKKPAALSGCNAPGNHPFVTTISVENDGDGNPVVSFTGYTLKFAPGGGKAPSPLIFICLAGQATFDTGQDNIRWIYNPGDFTKSARPNPHADTQIILNNTNATEGVFRYSVVVQTADFGEMIIDPRVENGGGGTNAASF